MDPSKLQSDSDNDAHSLEGTGTIVDPDKEKEAGGDTNTSSNVIDASTPGEPQKKQESAKPPVFKRIWQKFNIYLLLFVFVILLSAGIAVYFFFKNRSASVENQGVINSQNLSEETLKQLANSSVTVGNSKQVLNVESNAVFAGSVLVRSNLEVAGTIKVGGDLQLPGITVSGTSRFSELQADNVTIGGTTVVQGVFTARRGVNVSGNSTFDGISAAQITTNTLQLNGELALTHHIVAGGPIPGISRGGAVGAGGTVSLSGSDTSGSVVINTGGGPGAGCFANITFVRRFNSVPHVIITPVGSGAADVNYYVNRSTTGFSICTTNAAPAGQTFGFDYIVLG